MAVAAGRPGDEAAAALDQAVAACCDALGGVVGQDWDATTDELTWSVETTLEHTAGCLIGYAGQVVGAPEQGWAVPDVPLEKGMTHEQVVAYLLAAGKILSSVVRTTPAESRGFHPYGSSDPEGFACMGIVEALVHTDDVMRTFGSDWVIPAEAAQVALGRLFRDAPAGDPVQVLLWCTGRQPLGDLPQRTRWRWDGTPLA
jgi:hypothetical protein